MKVGDLVLLRPLDFFHIKGTQDLRDIVREKLKEQVGVGIVMGFDDEEYDVCVYWSNDECSWEFKEDLEIISENDTN